MTSSLTTTSSPTTTFDALLRHCSTTIGHLLLSDNGDHLR
jgi:hypothetical protein